MSDKSLDLNPQSLAESIRDRVRTQIVAVIPDEQINALIKKEWDGYFNDSSTRWENGRQVAISKFQDDVRKEMDKYIREKIEAAIAAEMKSFTELQWQSKGEDYIKHFVAGYAPVALEGIGARLAQESLNNVMSNIRNNPNYGRNY